MRRPFRSETGCFFASHGRYDLGRGRDRRIPAAFGHGILSWFGGPEGLVQQAEFALQVEKALVLTKGVE
jgi:hypothetical protein